MTLNDEIKERIILFVARFIKKSEKDHKEIVLVVFLFVQVASLVTGSCTFTLIKKNMIVDFLKTFVIVFS